MLRGIEGDKFGNIKCVEVIEAVYQRQGIFVCICCLCVFIFNNFMFSDVMWVYVISNVRRIYRMEKYNNGELVF